MNDNKKLLKISISIIGAGSWGTTLAIMLAQKGYNVRLWARSESTLDKRKKNKL